MAVVASILTAIYHMLKDGTMYKDLKTLEEANIKLDSVLTDLMGKSGRAIIEGTESLILRAIRISQI
jgi:hypothetical protein